MFKKQKTNDVLDVFLAWDQSDKFMKIYVPFSGLPIAGVAKENIKIEFTETLVAFYKFDCFFSNFCGLVWMHNDSCTLL